VFAPKVAKAHAKAAESPTGKLAPQHSVFGTRPFGGSTVEQAHFLQRTIGNQATLRLMAQQTSSLTGNESYGDHELEMNPEGMIARDAPRGVSRDFSKIPLFPPDQVNRPQAAFPPSALPSPSIIQPKHAVGEINDPLEYEADRVADQVMLIPDPRLSDTAIAPQISLKCAACDSVLPSAPPAAQSGLQSQAAPLDAASRRFFDSRFAYDFSGVRVHANPAAARSAAAIEARAFTVGEHIVLGAGETADAAAGRRLLAHELAHVVQQDRGRRSGGGRGTKESLETEAERASLAIDRGRVRIEGSGPLAVAREIAPPPQVAKLLSPSDIAKLQGFGPGDYQESLNALQEILNKTKGFTSGGWPQQYVDIRQAAGELRAFLDYIRNPNIAAAKVVPSQMGNRSPDFYLRDVAGREFRGEVVNITQASKDIRPDLGKDPQGRDVPRIPKSEAAPGTKPSVELPTTEFKLRQIKSAITAKINPKAAGGATQLDAQNPATQVAGRPMATGGDVVVEVLEGSASKAELDQIITDLLPKLKPSSAKRVLISIIDAADPSAGRKVFEYVRGEGDIFAGTARAAYYKPGAAGAGAAEALTPPAEAPVQGAPGEKLVEPVTPAETPTSGEGVKPAETLKPGEAAAPSVASRAATAGKTKLRFGSGSKGRLALNLGLMAAVAVLDMLNRAQMSKAESERAMKWMEQTTNAPATSAKIANLVQQQRISIARRQFMGQTVYASLSMKLAFTNDVIDSAVLSDISITDTDESSFTSSVMSHEPIFGVEGKVWYVHVSLPLDQVEISEVERAQLELEKHDVGAAASQTVDPDRLSALGEERERLQVRLREAKIKEAAAKREALGRSTIIADAAKRAQQQEEIADELRKQAAKQPSSVAPSQPQSPRASGPSLLSPALAEDLQLLPGAPQGDSPIAKAAKTVAASSAWADRLEAVGTTQRDRLGSNNRPSQQEIDAFLTEEHNWRLMTKWWMNRYTEESRLEAVNGLGELLDRHVPKLQELRVQLGGD
jgi:hypothetical protein